MRVFLPIALLLLVIISPAQAVVNFPALTGRVVDNAHLLSLGDVSAIEQQLERHEKQTSNQLVVITISSLQDLSIKEYGYQLGRHWGIGQAGKNNGALLIVAPKDRQVRIDVGYGLEGVLTDAVTSRIIQAIILPKFRDEDYAGGIKEGVVSILSILEGKELADIASPEEMPLIVKIFIVIFIIIFIMVMIFGKRGGGGFGGWSSGGGGGGGFRGGGGSFGGGGSSGKW